MNKNNDQYFLPIEGIENLLAKSKKEDVRGHIETKSGNIISFSKMTKQIERKKELYEISEFLDHYKIF